MRISSTSSAVKAPSTSGQAAGSPGAATPAPANDQFFSSNPAAVNVTSFNTAGDNCLHTPQAKIPDSPLFQKVIQGTPDAPIVACQETVPLLGKKMIDLSKNGNFQVVWPGHRWLPNWVPTSTLVQGNMVLVPKRYQIENVETHTFKGRWPAFFKALKNWVLGKGKANDMLLALQHRGWESLLLKDRVTGKLFTVIATHIAFADKVRREETPQLQAAIAKAQRQGPTVIMGDFNTPTRATNYNHDANINAFWDQMDATGMKDMGPTGKAAISNWMNNNDMDEVLATGFTSASAQMLTGSKMRIPSRPDAKGVSDHYAEADSLTFS